MISCQQDQAVLSDRSVQSTHQKPEQSIAEIKKLFGDPFVVSAVSMHERVDIAPVCIQIPSALAGLVKQIPHVQEEVAFHREGVQGTAR